MVDRVGKFVRMYWLAIVLVFAAALLVVRGIIIPRLDVATDTPVTTEQLEERSTTETEQQSEPTATLESDDEMNGSAEEDPMELPNTGDN